ncbi:cobyrinate a,c-diamide synthase [Brevibacillus ginsengisoli]|uniref:cobyrinate a,c-diamide synthase n=1 Tax=Brevibacillus ginsengisoli TaxID=363854 RepID=UPI003CF3933D
MTERRLVIAGTGSGVGKTTLTIGLMSALRKQNVIVQGFKCGPDYIDPSYHTAVTDRPSRNLDSWMLPAEVVREIFLRGSRGAQISIVEGVMGFFDGRSPDSNAGSSAEISEILESPVILVVNCASMARSVAAVVKGFQTFSDGPNIVGVIANRVGSEHHYQLVKAAIEQECGIPVVGYLKKELDIEIPERHLGLVPSIERGELDAFFDRLGEMVQATIDLEQIMELAKAKPLPHQEVSLFDRARGGEETTLLTQEEGLAEVTIAVAKDAAFNFYYPENLELLEACGAKLVYFSPLNEEKLPETADGLYIGGGFPEEFAEQLSAMEEVKASIRRAIQRGLPTFAECGGFMYLTEAIETRDGRSYEMVGVIPGKVNMQKRLAALGYREIKGMPGNSLLPEGLQAKGHEFHYSIYTSQEPIRHAYQIKGARVDKEEGYMDGNLIAGYTHFHFASCPDMVHNWLTRCKEAKHNG